jgi:hypothetical protein
MTEDLVFRCWVDPQGLKNSFDEDMLRNFAGYTADCAREGIALSPFQILLMTYAGGTLHVPDFWMPVWVLDWVTYLLAYGVGGLILGYAPRYPEYNHDKKKNP